MLNFSVCGIVMIAIANTSPHSDSIFFVYNLSVAIY